MSGTSRPPRAARLESSDYRSVDSAIAADVKALVLAGDRDAARHRFGELVEHQQRRALRLAYQYLRDAHDAEEAVQDAFVKVFTHITTFRADRPFEVWFTRIVVNACLDLRKARARRLRWVLPLERPAGSDLPPTEAADREQSSEARLIGRARLQEIAAAVDQLPERQRAVFILSHFGEQTTAQVSASLGVSEATVRVHLFRAVRKLRRLLERK